MRRVQDDRQIRTAASALKNFFAAKKKSAKSSAARKVRRLNRGIGMGYVPPEFAKPDTQIEIEIRGKRFAAVVVKKPIFQKV